MAFTADSGALFNSMNRGIVGILVINDQVFERSLMTRSRHSACSAFQGNSQVAIEVAK